MAGKSKSLKFAFKTSVRRTIFRNFKDPEVNDLTFQHLCDLPPPGDLIERYICNGWCVHLRRTLKRWEICSEDNARTKLFFKSSNAISSEKYKHLEYNFYMIHPFSVGRAYWEFFMFIVFLVTLLYLPFYYCASYEKISLYYGKLLFDIICTMDIIMSFWTGYQHPLTKKVIMRKRTVIRHYIQSWFVIDVLSSINLDILIIVLYRYFGINVWYIRLVSMVKIFRVSTVLLYLRRLKEWYHFGWFTHQVMRMTVIVTVAIVWNVGALYLVAKLYQESWMPMDEAEFYTGIKTVMSRTVGCLLVIGEGGAKSTTMPVYALEVLFTIVGWIFRIMITSGIALIIMKSNPLRTNYNKLVQQFNEYVAKKNLPRIVKRRVLSYLEFRFRKKFYRESAIYKTLSNSLRQEVNVCICKRFLIETPLFRYLPNEVVSKLSDILHRQIYLPNDVIATVGAPFDCVIFMSIGIAAVYNAEGQEVRHITEGQCFGELYLFINDPHSLETIVAVDFCELYMINQTDFIRILAPYPDIWSHMAKVVKLELADISSILSTITTVSLSQASTILRSEMRMQRDKSYDEEF